MGRVLEGRALTPGVGEIFFGGEKEGYGGGLFWGEVFSTRNGGGRKKFFFSQRRGAPAGGGGRNFFSKGGGRASFFKKKKKTVLGERIIFIFVLGGREVSFSSKDEN